MRRVLLASITAVAVLAGCTGTDRQSTPLDPQSGAQVIELLRSPWTFTIQDQNRRSIGTLVVRFTNLEAKSCVGGEWKKVTVVSFESTGEPAFPGRDPLSYEVKDGKLSIGRNEVCDAYIVLSGDFKDNRLEGEYFSSSWERRNLGYVTGKPSR